MARQLGILIPGLSEILVQPSKQGHCLLGTGSWASCPLTTVTFIAVVATVIFQVTFVRQWDTGPRILATELSIQITNGSS